MSQTETEALKKMDELKERGIVDRPVLRHDGWTFGELVQTIEDDEHGMWCSGEDGIVILETVGGEGNTHVCISVLFDGGDCPFEVQSDDIQRV